MKANPLACALLVLLAVAVQLPAQQPLSSSGTNSAATNSVTGGTFEKTKAKAEKGDAVAQYLLGRAYEVGQGVEPDAAEAVKWFRKSAEQGNLNAQTDLAFHYVLGDGVTKDLSLEVYWFRKAAEQGGVVAQNIVGSMYYEGRGVPKDYIEAYK